MQRDQIEALQAQIEAGVADLVGGDAFWQRWLSVAARFPKYSFRNQLLILAQRPDARVVMGYRAWQALGHQVRRGEASISIFAPCTYKTKAGKDHIADKESDDHTEETDDRGRGGERRVLRGFRVAHVFDIAQTDGNGVRPPARPELLDGEAPAGLWDSLAGQVAAAGFTLTRDVIPSGANGVTNFATRTVTVADHLAAAQAAKTLAHDLLTAPGPGPPLGRRDLFEWSRSHEDEEGRDDGSDARSGRAPGCERSSRARSGRVGGDLDPDRRAHHRR